MDDTTSILLVDKRYDFLNLMEIILQSEFDIQILKANSISEALQILQRHEYHIKAIVSHCFDLFEEEKKEEQEKTEGEDQKERETNHHLHDHYHYNIQNENIPFILHSGNSSPHLLKRIKRDNPSNSYLDNPLDEELLYHAVSRFFSPPNENHSPPKSSFKKVRTKLLSLFSKKNFDLYIKLNEEKFIQISNKESHDSEELIEHYQKKGVHSLYLREEDYSEFIHSAKDLILLNTKERINSERTQFTTLEIFDFTYHISRDHLKALKVPPLQEELINSAVGDIIEELKENRTIYELFKNHYRNNHYLSNHSFLIIYLGGILLKKLNWSNEQTLKQHIFASFFHDMFISEHLARIKYPKELTSAQEREEVLTHIEKGAAIVDGLRGINNDAHKIIYDHHELPDGSGFPHALKASQIPPLSCVFLISHHIVDYLYDREFNTSHLADFIQKMAPLWSEGNFKRVYIKTRELLLD